ncbi:helix-turn-helix domain-containing protein [Erwinia pyrifoliae]|uniref:helix-turn-helix domain-containing protein n=1 Tax=Erwinia pyrifoliae TaxID=79967 RepID=UPI00223BE72E|nr:XRE family transcriptional regulator [Erwinia pyrifoliae]MCT2388741.1 XRE family transcriptional regulator [Erwinia pyrifoliae]MCU8586910.1 XRE family transcriptional regulator [Erwinia pyrifoliae]
MDRLQHHLAQTLKAQRATRGWSLTQAAQMTGVSKAMLGQIERAESSPTIATLWKIASGFNLPFSSFIAADIADRGAARSQGQLQGYRQPNHGMQIVPLFPFDAETGFEMLVVELVAGALSESSAHEQGVIEHAIVISGQLEIAVDGCRQRLKEGEALRFHADRPHSYCNPGETLLCFHNIIHYPRYPRR